MNPKQYKATWLRDCIQLIIVISILLWLVSFKEPDHDIVWKDNYKLEYNDFIAVDSLIEGHVAVSSIGIMYDIDEYGNYKAQAIFESNKSLISKLIVFSDVPYILNHEQGHFDIAQIISKALNRKLLGVKSSKTALKLFNSAIGELELLQKRYDLETNNSINHQNQNTWDTRLKFLR